MKIEPTENDIERVYRIYLNQSRIDFENGQLKLGDLPIIWARAELLYDMYLELKKIVGDSANPLMRKMGKPYGRNFYKTLGKAFIAARGETDDQALLNFLCAENAVIGWGRISVERDGEKWIIICPRGFPIAQAFRSKKMYSTVPVDSYFLGYFEGFITELMGEKYYGREEKCLALGDDHCRFVYEPVERRPSGIKVRPSDEEESPEADEAPADETAETEEPPEDEPKE